MLFNVTGAALTVTDIVFANPPSTVFAVIVVVPAVTGVTTPLRTVATAVSADVQVTFLFVALLGTLLLL